MLALLADANEQTVPDGFVEYLSSFQLRFLQQRAIGLDLYSSGYLGIGTFVVFVASCTIFLLALFQIIPRRAHIVWLLSTLGFLALALGFGATYLNFESLSGDPKDLIRDDGGAQPVTIGQEAAVIAIPLLVGAGTFVVNLLGCFYLSFFWAAGRILPEKRSSE